MKVQAILVLCAFAAVQGRSAGNLSSGKELANLGENPWIVHARIAVSTSGLLRTCGASLISSRWVLTAASCVLNERFTWLRFGVVDVIRPSLVIETSATRVHPYINAALYTTNRDIDFTENINSVAFRGGVVPLETRFCAFGFREDGNIGESLNCISVSLVETPEDEIVAFSDEGGATSNDLGAPLVSNGVQIGILQGAGNENAGIFVPVSLIQNWISSETGL